MTDNFFKDKDILVTGGCGSIGSEIIRHLLKYDVKRIRIFDHDEAMQFRLQQELKDYTAPRYLIGDVRDKERLKRAVEGVDIIFHAAALKHVPLCEYNPFEAVNTNVLGTQNLVDAAREEPVDRVMVISTDKAINPINTMGATKLLSEKLVINAGMGLVKTIFSCVRFGNVLGSSGSVVPVFTEQIRKGGPVTVTSKEMVRFFMTMPDAVDLILRATQEMKGREVFILKMKPLRIMDLAEVMIEELAPKYGHKPSKIKIKISGIRPGEKLSELLMTEEEAQNAKDQNDMFILRPTLVAPHVVERGPIFKKVAPEKYDARKAKSLSKAEIKKLLREEKLI